MVRSTCPQWTRERSPRGHPHSEAALSLRPIWVSWGQGRSQSPSSHQVGGSPGIPPNKVEPPGTPLRVVAGHRGQAPGQPSPGLGRWVNPVHFMFERVQGGLRSTVAPSTRPSLRELLPSCISHAVLKIRRRAQRQPRRPGNQPPRARTGPHRGQQTPSAETCGAGAMGRRGSGLPLTLPRAMRRP